MALLRKHGENLVPTPENAFELFPDAGAGDESDGKMAAIWESLINRTPKRAALPVQEFSCDPLEHRPLPLCPLPAAAQAGKKQGKR